MTKKHHDSSSVERAVERSVLKPKPKRNRQATAEQKLREVPKDTYQHLENSRKFRYVKICRRLGLDGSKDAQGNTPIVSTNMCPSCPLVSYGTDCINIPMNKNQIEPKTN